MKKRGVFVVTMAGVIAVAAFMLLVLTCSNQESAAKDGETNGGTTPGTAEPAAEVNFVPVKAMPADWVNKDPKVAEISMAIPLSTLKEASSRADSTANESIDTAMTYTNYFQIFVYDRPANASELPQTVYVLQYPEDSDQTFSLPGPYLFEDVSPVKFGITEAGDHFDIVVVAGHSASPGQTGIKPLLFAAGALQDQTITLGTINAFSVKLYSVNYTLTAPEEVHVRTADEIEGGKPLNKFSVFTTAKFNYKSPLANNVVPGYETVNNTGPNDGFHFVPGYNHLEILLEDETYSYQKMEVKGTVVYPSTSTWSVRETQNGTIRGEWGHIPVADIDWDTIDGVQVDSEGNKFVMGVLYHHAGRLHITHDSYFGLVQDAWSVAEYADPFFPISPYQIPIKFTTKDVTPTSVSIVVGWGEF